LKPEYSGHAELVATVEEKTLWKINLSRIKKSMGCSFFSFDHEQENLAYIEFHTEMMNQQPECFRHTMLFKLMRIPKTSQTM